MHYYPFPEALNSPIQWIRAHCLGAVRLACWRAVCCLLLPLASFGQVLQPAGVFGDNMVLQRDKPINVFGQGVPGAKVVARLNGQKSQAVANGRGIWRMALPPQRHGGPYVLQISSRKEKIAYKNVMVGDVWLASGQSNMGYKMKQGVLGHDREIAQADYPAIRYFEMANRPMASPATDIPRAPWLVCTPAQVGKFSAVAYFFAQKTYQATGIPIGILDVSWGGSAIEAWMNPAQLGELPHMPGPAIPGMGDAGFSLAEFHRANEKNAAKKLALVAESFQGIAHGVHKVGYAAGGWRQAPIENWRSEDILIHWFAKDFALSQLPSDTLLLALGAPGSQMDVWLNGTALGKAKTAATSFKVAPGLLKVGSNRLAFRLANPWWPPYLNTKSGEPCLRRPDRGVWLRLGGPWQWSDRIEPLLPKTYALQTVPSALYHGMLHPFFEVGLGGVIWYQGENNGGQGSAYRRLFPAMVNDWRARFAQAGLPFLFVQLANLGQPNENAENQGWPFLREAQALACGLPRTGMATAIDVGDTHDIHPKDKKTVGERLARLALHIKYGQPVVCHGPTYRSHVVVDGQVEVRFDHAEGLHAKGIAMPKGFAVAGPDRVFYPAKAMVFGGKVTLVSERVQTPVAVRYAWAKNPIANLYNEAGLPAYPFRTDNWPEQK